MINYEHKEYLVNILLIDKDRSIAQLMKILSEVEKEFNIISVLNFDDGINKYKNNTIDFVIVDFFDSENHRLFKEILKINPKQNAITLSDKIEYCYVSGCQYCIKNFEKKRLLKPVNAMELLSLIKNFNTVKCQYYNDFNDIETIMNHIVKRYIGCYYDTEKKVVQFKNSDYYTQKSMIDLSSILHEHNVYFKILDEHNIQIGSAVVQ